MELPEPHKITSTWDQLPDDVQQALKHAAGQVGIHPLAYEAQAQLVPENLRHTVATRKN